MRQIFLNVNATLFYLIHSDIASNFLQLVSSHFSTGGLFLLSPFLHLFAAVEVVWISVAILFVLFSVQRFGTDKVGYSFAPVISVWFVLIAGTGMYNVAVHDAAILRAFNPMYIVEYFSRNGKEAWVSLGGVVLCIGSEAQSSVVSKKKKVFFWVTILSNCGEVSSGYLCVRCWDRAVWGGESLRPRRG